MKRIYENRGFVRRQNISVAILVLVFLYGLFEFWRVFAGGGADTTGAMFGVLFLAGAAYGAKTVWYDMRDHVAAFDVDLSAGTGVVTLWSPFRTLPVAVRLDGISGWRHWVKVGPRGLRIHHLIATLPGYPRPVEFELRPGEEVDEAFRRLAPQAIEDLDENRGRRPASG